MKLVTRSGWGARAPKGSSRLGGPNGVKVHYTGDPENPKMVDDHALCYERVRAIQRSHMDGNDWADIGYSALVCLHGVVFYGRGPHVLPAANGAGLNSGHYAVCGLIGRSGLTKPSEAMLHGIRDAIEWLRDEGDAGEQIRGHRDGYSTDCPGDELYAWVRKGAPRPKTTQPQEDEMLKPLVDLGTHKPQLVKPGERHSIEFELEYLDTDKVHTDTKDGRGYPSVFPKGGDAAYSAMVMVELDGRPGEGVLLTIAAYERKADKFVRDVRKQELAVKNDILHGLVRMSESNKYRADLVNHSGSPIVLQEAYMQIAH